MTRLGNGSGCRLGFEACLQTCGYARLLRVSNVWLVSWCGVQISRGGNVAVRNDMS